MTRDCKLEITFEGWLSELLSDEPIFHGCKERGSLAFDALQYDQTQSGLARVTATRFRVLLVVGLILAAEVVANGRRGSGKMVIV